MVHHHFSKLMPFLQNLAHGDLIGNEIKESDSLQFNLKILNSPLN